MQVDTQRMDGVLEQISLVLLCLILVFSALAFGAVRATEFAVVTGLVLLALAVWLVRLWIAPTPRLLWPPVCWLALLFAGYALVRAHYAPVPFEAREETLRVAVYAAFFLWVLNNLYRQEASRWVTVCLSLLAVGISLYAIVQFATGDTMVWHLFKPAQYAQRGSGTFAYPNHLAGYLTLLLPLAITFTLAGRLNYPTRIITGYAALIMLGGIAVTLSRGGWLAAFAALVVLAAVLVAMRQYRWPALIILVVLLAGGFWFYGQAQEKIKRRVTAALDMGHDRDPRWRLWEAGLQLWQDSPWWGHGPAHFDLVYPKYRQPVNHTQLRPNFALNEYVNTLVDYGAAGVGLLTLAVAFGLGGGWRAWRALSHSTSQEELRGGKRAFLLGVGIGWTGLLLACVTDFHFHLPAIALTAFALLALMCGHLRFATERYWVTLSRPTLVIFSVFVVLTGGFLGMRAWRSAEHEYWQRKADRAESGTEQLAALHRAWESQPLSHWVAHQIGEYHRRKSWKQEGDYVKQARMAMEWFQRAIELNPLDSYALIRLGMCHDWLGEHDQAEPYFLRALELDPNNYYTLANMGWHYFQRRQYRRSKVWFAASLRLNWWDNPTAYTYYRAAERRWHELP